MKSVWIWDWKTFFSVQKEKTLFFVDNNQGSTFACRVMIKDSISINHAFCVHGSYESMAKKHTKTKRIHQRNHFNYSVASCTSHSIDFRFDFVIYTMAMAPPAQSLLIYCGTIIAPNRNRVFVFYASFF